MQPSAPRARLCPVDQPQPLIVSFKMDLESAAKPRAFPFLHSSFFILHSLFVLLILCSGCRTATPLAPVNLSAPGWQIQQGQAVWKPTANRPELAGDLLLATNANGDMFIQFTKMPFPMATAQLAGDHWRMEFGADTYAWSGRGKPPRRFSWFQLPRALLGVKPAGNWRFTREENDTWRLGNSQTGETLEGAFSP